MAKKKTATTATTESPGVRRSLRGQNSTGAPQTPILKRRKTEEITSPFFKSKASAAKEDQAESLEDQDDQNEDAEDPVSELHDGLSDVEDGPLLKGRSARNQRRVAASSDDDDSESSFNEADDNDTSSGESDVDENASDSSVASEAPTSSKKVRRAPSAPLRRPSQINELTMPFLQGVSMTDSATDPVSISSISEVASWEIEVSVPDAEIDEEIEAPTTARRRAPRSNKKKKDPVRRLCIQMRT